MKEYGIYIRHGLGKPFMIHFYDNFNAAKLKLYDLISLDEERGRPYFVDNDFFNNKYNISIKLNYYCIKSRSVSDWNNFSINELEENYTNKIIYFNNFKKSLTN